MKVPGKLVAVAAVAVALLGGGAFALIAFDKDLASQPSHSEMLTSSPMTAVSRHSRAADYDDTKKKRVTIPANDEDPVLVDVPDNLLDHADLEEFIGKRHIGAYRIVQVHSDALRRMVRESKERGSFGLQLLNAAPVTLVAIDAKEHSSGWQTGLATWLGRVEGDEASYASFVIGPDGSVNGVVRSQTIGRIKIERIAGTSHHIVWKLGEGFEMIID